MEVLYVCILLLFASSLGVPSRNHQGLRRMAETLSAKGGYGIVGGKPADIKKYPYTVSFVYYQYNHLFGAGAILNKNWIVCSAFEINGYIASEINVRVGSNSALSGGQNLNVSKIILNEKFHIGYPYDVAVVKLSKPIKLNKKAKPVKIAKAITKAGTKAQITGFGATEGSSSNSDDLQVATVEVQSQTDCQKVYPSIGDSCLCADAENVAPCYHDIGDPLVKNKQLYGWWLGGNWCNKNNRTGIYANAAELREWILDKIKKNSNGDEMQGIDDDDFYRSFDDDDENDNK